MEGCLNTQPEAARTRQHATLTPNIKRRTLLMLCLLFFNPATFCIHVSSAHQNGEYYIHVGYVIPLPGSLCLRRQVHLTYNSPLNRVPFIKPERSIAHKKRRWSNILKYYSAYWILWQPVVKLPNGFPTYQATFKERPTWRFQKLSYLAFVPVSNYLRCGFDICLPLFLT